MLKGGGGGGEGGQHYGDTVQEPPDGIIRMFRAAQDELIYRGTQVQLTTAILQTPGYRYFLNFFQVAVDKLATKYTALCIYVQLNLID